MPTIESDITQADCEAYLQHLTKCAEDSTPLPNPCLVHYKKVLAETKVGFWHGFTSLSLVPRHHVSYAFCAISDHEALLNDWSAVGHDLYASILQYARTDYLHGRDTEGDPESDTTWAIHSR